MRAAASRRRPAHRPIRSIPGDRGNTRGREQPAQSGAPAGTGCRAGLVRPDPRARRSQRPAIPAQRHHPARRYQRLQSDLESLADLLFEIDHRRTARRVRVANRRGDRFEHPERTAATGRRDFLLWRQPWHISAVRRIWRQRRSIHLLRDRRLQAGRSWHRIPRRKLESIARPHHARPCIRLLRGHHRLEQPGVAHPGPFGR